MTMSVHDDLDPIQVPTLPEDTLYLGASLQSIKELLEQLVEAGTRQENPAPNLVMLSQANPSHTWSVRMRVVNLVISDTAAFTDFAVGALGYRFLGNAARPIDVVPFPIIVDNGITITWSGMAGADSRLYVFAYPETAK